MGTVQIEQNIAH